MFSSESKIDSHVKDIDFISKVNMVFTSINKINSIESLNSYKDQARDMKIFIDMVKHSHDIAFITNYVQEAYKFRKNLVR